MGKDPMISIVSWLWSSSEKHPKKELNFQSEHVNKLYNMLKRNITREKYEFCCITDMPDGLDEGIRVIPLWDDFREMGGCYTRLKLFSAEMREIFPNERVLSMDIDALVLQDISSILRQVYTRDFIAWGDTHPRTHYNGSLWGLKIGSNPQVWECFKKNPQDYINIGKKSGFVGTDQAIMSVMFGDSKMRWSRRDGVYSFNIDIVRKKIAVPPMDAKLIFFHGRYDPSQKKLYDRYPWIPEYWQ